MNRLKYLLCFFLVMSAMELYPCTTIALRHGDKSKGIIGNKGAVLRIAKSYDWDNGNGFVMANKAGLKKMAFLPLIDDPNPLGWTSTYGSLTFNQYGREFPNGGMNQTGLVVEIMKFSESIYSKAQKLHAGGVRSVNCFQWIQFQLDTASTVEAAIINASSVRLANPIVQLPDPKGGKKSLPIVDNVHFLVADALGECAAIEYIDGNLKIYSTVKVNGIATEDLPRTALANSPYSDSMNAYEAYQKSGRYPGNNSLKRFCIAAKATETFANTKWESDKDGFEKDAQNPKTPTGFAFAALDSVEIGTQWHIVYAPLEGHVSWRSVYKGGKTGVCFGVNMFNAANILQMNTNSPLMVFDIRAGKKKDKDLFPVDIDDTVDAKGSLTGMPRAWRPYWHPHNVELTRISLGMRMENLVKEIPDLTEVDPKVLDKKIKKRVDQIVEEHLKKIQHDFVEHAKNMPKAIRDSMESELMKKWKHEAVEFAKKQEGKFIRQIRKQLQEDQEGFLRLQIQRAADIWSAYPLTIGRH